MKYYDNQWFGSIGLPSLEELIASQIQMAVQVCIGICLENGIVHFGSGVILEIGIGHTGSTMFV